MAGIMLALDGSTIAEDGITQAVGYCGPEDELLLVRVAGSLPSTTEGERQLDGYLSGLAARLRGLGLKVFTETRFGRAAEQIVEAARQQHVDLLILCSRSHGWRRLLFGSVSEAVSRHAACPVLIK